MPKFSVVVPLYNKGAHIVETIESVISQNYTDFEVIIIDDGSTDDGLAKVKSVADHRIKIHEQKNQGVSAARNRGVKEAAGEYVAFLDADDCWYPWHLSEMEALISKVPGAALYCVAHDILQEGKIYRRPKPLGSEFVGKVPDFFDAYSKGFGLVNSTTACLPKSFLLENTGFPLGVKKGEDVYVWIRAGVFGGVAHSAKSCARINRDAQARSNLILSDEVPFYIEWLDDFVFSSGLSEKDIKSAKRFLEKGVFFNAAGFCVDGNREAFNRIMGLKISKTIKFRALLGIMQITPPTIFKFMRKLRHSLA